VLVFPFNLPQIGIQFNIIVKYNSAYFLFVINHITRTKERYRKVRRLKFCGTMHYRRKLRRSLDGSWFTETRSGHLARACFWLSSTAVEFRSSSWSSLRWVSGRVGTNRPPPVLIGQNCPVNTQKVVNTGQLKFQ